MSCHQNFTTLLMPVFPVYPYSGSQNLTTIPELSVPRLAAHFIPVLIGIDQLKSDSALIFLTLCSAVPSADSCMLLTFKSSMRTIAWFLLISLVFCEDSCVVCWQNVSSGPDFLFCLCQLALNLPLRLNCRCNITSLL